MDLHKRVDPYEHNSTYMYAYMYIYTYFVDLKINFTVLGLQRNQKKKKKKKEFRPTVSAHKNWFRKPKRNLANVKTCVQLQVQRKAIHS